MGNTSSRLKGDAIPDLTTQPSELSAAPPKPTSLSLQPTSAKHTTSTTTTNPLQTTNTHTLPHEPSTTQPDKHAATPSTTNNNNKPRKQSLAQRWKERKGVPEPKDENGRGIYSGKTTEELIKQARQQIVDGRMLAANSC
jgi:hypothetical protein